MPVKFAFIGQDIPMHLPFLLVDFLYAGKEDGILAVEEKNAAMRDVLQHYAEAIVYASGRKAQIIVSGNRQEVLMGADCVVYAGDCMAATRFRQDQEALGGVKEDDPGLSDQARVHGGIEGLLHTLRQGEVVLDLCRNMRSACPKAIVVTLGQPVARTTTRPAAPQPVPAEAPKAQPGALPAPQQPRPAPYQGPAQAQPAPPQPQAQPAPPQQPYQPGAQYQPPQS